MEAHQLRIFNTLWVVDKGRLIRIRVIGGHEAICGVHLRGIRRKGLSECSVKESREEALLTAQRICDCVNALEGIPNPLEWVTQMKQKTGS